MKKKIAILGSTGSIGKNTVNIIQKNKENFEVQLLSTNKNIKEILNQVKKLNVKNIIVTDYSSYKKIKLKLKNRSVKVYNNFNAINKIFKKKIDYTMSAITGLAGLEPTIDIIKFTKVIAIANKESIICAWNLIKKELKKNNAKFIPVDSEHFSIWNLLNEKNNTMIKQIIITASGGPFLKIPKKKIDKINPKYALKHPNWKMGKKISIDSATMMNKVFELIEAQRIFEIEFKKLKILIHPKSYLHAIIQFENGITKMLVHDTDMSIPIFNSIYNNNEKKFKTKKINLSILNNLNLIKPSTKKFPSLKILKYLNNKVTLFETIIIAANDYLVSEFLSGRITFSQITDILLKLLKVREFSKYKHSKPRNLRQIYSLIELVRLKTNQLYIK